MKNFIGWKKLNHVSLGNVYAPEWMFYGIFIIVIIAAGITMLTIGRIKPQEAILRQDGQIVVETVKTPLVADFVAWGEIRGVASWYDYDLGGVEWSKGHNTCATRGLNRNGMMRVTNLDNGKSVDCFVNDDGPRDCQYRYDHKLDKPGECVERIIDLSSHAFNSIADLGDGLINVKVEQL